MVDRVTISGAEVVGEVASEVANEVANELVNEVGQGNKRPIKRP